MRSIHIVLSLENASALMPEKTLLLNFLISAVHREV